MSDKKEIQETFKRIKEKCRVIDSGIENLQTGSDYIRLLYPNEIQREKGNAAIQGLKQKLENLMHEVNTVREEFVDASFDISELLAHSKEVLDCYNKDFNEDHDISSEGNALAEGDIKTTPEDMPRPDPSAGAETREFVRMERYLKEVDESEGATPNLFAKALEYFPEEQDK